MWLRLWGRMKFALERFVLGGPLNRLFVIAVLLAALTVIGGTLVHHFGGDSRPGDNYWGTLWWAFLRLSDPGYLGDDVGTFVRIVSTILTVLGYVVFLGSLVAIMTQWLNSTLARLQRGFTPLTLNNHILILGWSSRTVDVVREILLSEGRVERFLVKRGVGKLRVIILADEVTPEMIQELRDRLGDLWDPRQIVLRTGSALRLEHLRRADFLNAAAIVLPAPDSTVNVVEYPDARTIKTIMAIGRAGRESGALEPPLLVVELNDASKLTIARKAYGGPIEVISNDLIVGRLLAQNIRHPGISHVYTDMLRHDAGSEIYLRAFPELIGKHLSQISPLFLKAVPLGLMHGRGHGCKALLNPAADITVGNDDRLVLLAADYDDARPTLAIDAGALEFALTRRAGDLTMPKSRKVLLLGWNHVVPALLRELDGFADEIFSVDIISLVPASQRSEELKRLDVSLSRTTLRLLEGEYTSLADLRELNVGSYNSIVVLSSDRLESEGERDARSILGSLVLHEALGDIPNKPHVLVELLHQENLALVDDHGDEAVLSPAIMSHILAQVALHRDLRVVYDELFGPEGSEIFFRPAAHYGITGRAVTFPEIQAAATASSEVALGLRIAFNGKTPRQQSAVFLNPDRKKEWNLSQEDYIVVLANI